MQNRFILSYFLDSLLGERSLRPPVSMGQRYAYIIAIGENEQIAKENAKTGARQISFLLSRYTEKETEQQRKNSLDKSE